MDALIIAGLTLRQLRLIQALGDHGQMQRAAVHLRISQPAASKLLSQVETIVRARLFDRLPRGLVPTIYGEVLLRHTQTALTEISVAEEELVALRDGRGGRVAVGSVMAPAVDTVAVTLGALRQDMPRLAVTFEIETSDILVSRLLANELDLVVARIPTSVDPKLFDYEELSQERACLVVRDKHPLASLDVCPLTDMPKYDWIFQHRGSLLRRAVEALLRSNGVALPDRIIETSSFLAMMVLLDGTDAIAPLASPVADLLLRKGQFCTLRLTESLVVEPYGLIRVKGRPLSPAVASFYERLKRDFVTRAADA